MTYADDLRRRRRAADQLRGGDPWTYIPPEPSRRHLEACRSAWAALSDAGLVDNEGFVVAVLRSIAKEAA